VQREKKRNSQALTLDANDTSYFAAAAVAAAKADDTEE
jgi:hypothetical protein